jgi:hypothetical protein
MKDELKELGIDLIDSSLSEILIHINVGLFFEVFKIFYTSGVCLKPFTKSEAKY